MTHRYCDNPAAVVVEKSGRRVFASPLAGVCRLSGKPGVVPTQLWELATTREKALRLAAARGGSERQDGSGDGEGRSDLADAAEAA